MTRVLIIDDDESLTRLLQEYLGRFGFTVAAAATPASGLRALRDEPPDLIVLDVMLPDTDGITLLRKIRETSRIPVVMLTARGDVVDRIVGLESGADDYLPKPFEPRELVARLQAVLRRATAPAGREDLLRAGALVIHWTTRSATLEGRTLPLTGAEFELLALFVRHAGRVLSRDRIMDETRGVNWEAYDRSIDVLVSRLRQKLGDDVKRPMFIRTVRGAGYTFVGGGA